MEIKLVRKHFGEDFSIGELTIDSCPDKIWYTIEDKDRDLNQNMLLPEITRIKVHGETAIPYGRYSVVISRSNRFKIDLPEILNIKGWAGVRMHVGNYAKDTEGCILPGKGFDVKNKMITGSRIAFGEVFEQIEKAFKGKQAIFITITKAVK